MPYAISPELYWVRRGVWHHFVIEMKGEDLTVTPPPEFADVLESLQPERADERADSSPDGGGPLSI